MKNFSQKNKIIIIVVVLLLVIVSIFVYDRYIRVEEIPMTPREKLVKDQTEKLRKLRNESEPVTPMTRDEVENTLQKLREERDAEK